MEFFDNLAGKYYKRPKKVITKDPNYKKIDWEDFNYPSSYPLFHYDKEELRDENAKNFISVTIDFLSRFILKL